MNRENIIAVLRDLNLVSGFRVSLHTAEFKEIAAYPEEKLPFCAFLHAHSEEEFERCRVCDREAAANAKEDRATVIYRCRHGLTEIISPIYSFGVLTGYLMMGQVMPEEGDTEGMFSAIRRYDGEADAEALIAATPRLSEEKAKAYVRIMSMCAEKLTTDNILPYAKRTVGQIVRRYVDEHYGDRIVISEMCRAIGYSKSTLYTSFRKEYGITINEYITKVRIDEATKLLVDRDIPIGDVAERVGFRNQSYFSNIFAAERGMTPSEYRRKNSV